MWVAMSSGRGLQSAPDYIVCSVTVPKKWRKLTISSSLGAHLETMGPIKQKCHETMISSPLRHKFSSYQSQKYLKMTVESRLQHELFVR